MSLNHGTPPLDLEMFSWISPASPKVWPSCTATRESTRRSLKVGDCRPVVVTPEATSLTSCEISSVTRPPLLTRGVTSMMTPVCWYCT
jgi:hypothetical protein